MNDKELNEAIAILRGWVKENKEPAPQITIWKDPANNGWLSCPDFCNDWGYAGLLLEEIKNCRLEQDVDAWECRNFDKYNLNTDCISNTASSKNIKRAIAMEWYAINKGV